MVCCIVAVVPVSVNRTYIFVNRNHTSAVARIFHTPGSTEFSRTVSNVGSIAKFKRYSRNTFIL